MKKVIIGIIPALFSASCAQGAVKERGNAACPAVVVEFKAVRPERVAGANMYFGEFHVTNAGPGALRIDTLEAWGLPLVYQRSVSMERQVGSRWMTHPVLEELEPPKQTETIEAGDGWTFYQEMDGWVKTLGGKGEAVRLALSSRDGCTYYSAPFRLPSAEP